MHLIKNYYEIFPDLLKKGAKIFYGVTKGGEE